MVDPFDCKTGDAIVEGRPNQDGTFDILLYSKPNHGGQPGEDVAPGDDPGELSVILRMHDLRACDSMSLAIRLARKALEANQLRAWKEPIT